MRKNYIKIIDDFYDYPDEIVSWANKLEFFKPESGEKWPGLRTKNIKFINKEFYFYFCERLFEKLEIEPKSYVITTAFQKIKRFSNDRASMLNSSWEHKDGAESGGVIYLNKITTKSSGTKYVEPNTNYSLIREKVILNEINDIRFNLWARNHKLNDLQLKDYNKYLSSYSNMFDPIFEVENIYNRFLIHDNENWHKHSSFFIEKDNFRLVQVFFLNKI